MQADVRQYLEEVRLHLHLDPGTERQLIDELAAHFEDKLDDLRQQGLAEREAEHEALASFGGARSIARMLYEAHSRGSWIETFLACQPHLLAAALFAAHLWSNLVALLVLSVAYAAIATVGWVRGRPAWIHSWAGYAFLPLLVLCWLSRRFVLATGAAVLTGQASVLSAWLLVLVLACWAGGLWLLISALVRVARRDWIDVSLMLMPLPVLGLWLASAERLVVLAAAAPSALDAHRWDTAMGWVCLLLGVASALFIRARSRALKAGAVVAVGILCGAAVARSVSDETGLAGLAAVAVCMALLLLSPALLRGEHGRSERDEQRRRRD